MTSSAHRLSQINRLGSSARLYRLGSTARTKLKKNSRQKLLTNKLFRVRFFNSYRSFFERSRIRVCQEIRYFKFSCQYSNFIANQAMFRWICIVFSSKMLLISKRIGSAAPLSNSVISVSIYSLCIEF